MITNGKNKNEIRQFPKLPNNGVVGGAGPMGWVAGSGAKLFKGALSLIKNVLGGSSKTSKTTGVIKNAFNKPPVVNQSRNLKQQWPSHKFKSGIGKRGSIPTSQPVNFKGPNPMHNTGAGGNSYPR